jgi:hypothetical protein
MCEEYLLDLAPWRAVRQATDEGRIPMREFLLSFMLSSPLWTPIVFGAYALGKKQFGLAFLFLFITSEAVSLVMCMTARFILNISTAQLGGP